MQERIVLTGLGHLGKIHLKLLHESKCWKLAGVFDIDQNLTRELALKYQVKAFNTLAEAIDHCDAMAIVTPGNTHFEIAKSCIMAGKHVFVEKPVTSELKEAYLLKKLAQEAGVAIQVGHVERFNPAYQAALPYLKEPVLIEIQRLATYNVRGTDVSVVKDLSLHDIDLLLRTVKANVRKISAKGTTFISRSADVLNARIEFDNGCVASIITNRISFNNERSFRAFTADHLINIDLLNKVSEVIEVRNATPDSKQTVIDPGMGLPKKELSHKYPTVHSNNAINEELNSFYKSINEGFPIAVSIDDSIKVMEVLQAIEELI